MIFPPLNKLLIAVVLSLGIVSGANTTPVGLDVDLGGSIVERMAFIELLKQSKTDVEISGVCISACTMYLGLSSVCVKEGTIFGFHSANLDGVKSTFGNAILMEYYPPEIKKWVKENKALESLDLTFMNAEMAWNLGIKKCGTQGQ